MAQQSRPETSLVVKDFVAYVREKVVDPNLKSYSNGPPLHELFIFDRGDTMASLVNGASRGAIDTALANPQTYIDVRFFLSFSLYSNFFCFKLIHYSNF